MRRAISRRLLTDAHRRHLEASGLTDESIECSGCWSATEEEASNLLGFDAGAGLVIPYPGAELPSGVPYVRVRVDEPWVDASGRAAKYLAPARSRNPGGNHAYFPPALSSSILKDASVPLIVTEGEKKALKAQQEGLNTIALAGVWSWKTKDGNESRVIADLDAIEWNRDVYIVFDSDAASNPQVERAEEALRRELRSRGARVSVVRLPEPAGDEISRFGGKLGLDDLLVSRGPEALRNLINVSDSVLPLGCQPITFLAELDEEDQGWLVEGLWRLEDCGFFAGPPKTMKSFFALALAISVATGRDFLGRPVARGPVVIVDEENRRRELRGRLQALCLATGASIEELSDLYLVSPGKLRLDETGKVEDLDVLLGRLKPLLLILDPLVRLHRREENDASQVAPMLSDLRTLQHRHQVAIVVVHHFRKGSAASGGQQMRGSSDLHGWLDAAIYFKDRDSGIHLTFESRYGRESDPMDVRLVEAGEGLAWEVEGRVPPSPRRADHVDRVLESLRKQPDGMTTSQLSKELGINGTSIKEIVAKLESEGRISAESQPTGGAPRTVHRLTGRRDLSDNSAPLGDVEAVRKAGDAPEDRHINRPNKDLGSPGLSDNSLSGSPEVIRGFTDNWPWWKPYPPEGAAGRPTWVRACAEALGLSSESLFSLCDSLAIPGSAGPLLLEGPKLSRFRGALDAIANSAGIGVAVASDCRNRPDWAGKLGLPDNSSIPKGSQEVRKSARGTNHGSNPRSISGLSVPGVGEAGLSGSRAGGTS